MTLQQVFTEIASSSTTEKRFIYDNGRKAAKRRLDDLGKARWIDADYLNDGMKHVRISQEKQIQSVRPISELDSLTVEEQARLYPVEYFLRHRAKETYGSMQSDTNRMENGKAHHHYNGNDSKARNSFEHLDSQLSNALSAPVFERLRALRGTNRTLLDSVKLGESSYDVDSKSTAQRGSKPLAALNSVEQIVSLNVDKEGRSPRLFHSKQFTSFSSKLRNLPTKKEISKRSTSLDEGRIEKIRQRLVKQPDRKHCDLSATERYESRWTNAHQDVLESHSSQNKIETSGAIVTQSKFLPSEDKALSPRKSAHSALDNNAAISALISGALVHSDRSSIMENGAARSGSGSTVDSSSNSSIKTPKSADRIQEKNTGVHESTKAKQPRVKSPAKPKNFVQPTGELLASSAQSKKRAYNVDKIRDYMRQKRSERARLAATSPPREPRIEHKRPYDADTLHAFMHSKASELERDAADLRRRARTEASAREERLHKVVRTQQLLAAVPVSKLWPDTYAVSANTKHYSDDAVETIRKRFLNRVDDVAAISVELEGADEKTLQIDDSFNNSVYQQDANLNIDKVRSPRVFSLISARIPRTTGDAVTIDQPKFDDQPVSMLRDNAKPLREGTSQQGEAPMQPYMEAVSVKPVQHHRHVPQSDFVADASNIINTIKSKYPYLRIYSDWQVRAMIEGLMPFPPEPTQQQSAGHCTVKLKHVSAADVFHRRSASVESSRTSSLTSSLSEGPLPPESISLSLASTADQQLRNDHPRERPRLARHVPDVIATTSQADLQTSSPSSVEHGPSMLAPDTLGGQLKAGLVYLKSLDVSQQHVMQLDMLRQVTGAQQQAIAAGSLLQAQHVAVNAGPSQNAGQAEIRRYNNNNNDQGVFVPVEQSYQASRQVGGSELGTVAAAATKAAVMAVLESLDRKATKEAPAPRTVNSSTSNEQGSSSSPVVSSSTQYSHQSQNSDIAVQTAQDISLAATALRSRSTQSVATAMDSANERLVPTSMSSIAHTVSDAAEKSLRSEIVEEIPVSSARSSRLRHRSSESQSESFTSPGSEDNTESWRAERDEFGNMLTKNAKKLLRGKKYRAEQQQAILSRRREALREYMETQIALIHLQRKVLELEGRHGHQMHALDEREKAIAVQYTREKAHLQMVASETSDNVGVALMEQQEAIRQLQLRTLNTCRRIEYILDFEQFGDVVSGNSLLSPGRTVPQVLEDTLQFLQQHTSAESAERYRSNLAMRRARATQLLQARHAFDAEEAAVRQLEKEALQAWIVGGASSSKQRAILPTIDGKPEKDKSRSASSTRRSASPSSSSSSSRRSSTSGKLLKRSPIMALDLQQKTAASSSSVSEAIAVSAEGQSASRVILLGSRSPSIAEELPSAGQSHDVGSSSSVADVASAVVGSKSTSTIPTVPSDERTLLQNSHSMNTAAANSITEQSYNGSDKTVSESKSSSGSSSSSTLKKPALQARSTGLSATKMPKVPTLALGELTNLPLDDSFSFSLSAIESPKIVARVKLLKDQLLERRQMARKLKDELKLRNRERLNATEHSLQRQIQAYEKFIEATQQQIQDLQMEVAVGTADVGTPPRIMSSPRAAGVNGSEPPSISTSPSKLRRMRSSSVTSTPRSEPSSRAQSPSKQSPRRQIRDGSAEKRSDSDSVAEDVANDVESARSSEQRILEESSREDVLVIELQDGGDRENKEIMRATMVQSTLDEHDQRSAGAPAEDLCTVDEVTDVPEDAASPPLSAIATPREASTSADVPELPPDEETTMRDSPTQASSLIIKMQNESIDGQILAHDVAEKSPVEKLDAGVAWYEKLDVAAATHEPAALNALVSDDRQISTAAANRTAPWLETQADAVFAHMLQQTMSECIAAWRATNRNQEGAVKQLKEESFVNRVANGLFNELVLSSVRDIVATRSRSAVENDLSASFIREADYQRILEYARQSLDRQPDILAHKESVSVLSPRSPRSHRFDAVYPESPRKSGQETEVLSLTGNELEVEWMDDEFTTSPRATSLWSPDASQKAKLSFSTSVFSAVPHKPEDIKTIVATVADQLWQERRYGHTLSDTVPAAEVFIVAHRESNDFSFARKSDEAFRQFLFDLCKDIAVDVLEKSVAASVAIDNTAPWEQRKRLKLSKFAKAQPTSSTELTDVLLFHVSRLIGVETDTVRSKTVRQSRKKLDAVDKVLINELYEEEHDWTAYDAEELQVKFQVADAIWQELLNDAVHFTRTVAEV